MPRGGFDPELAAAVLVEATLAGDKETAKKYGISPRSIERWRRRVEVDGKLAELVAVKKGAAERDWADNLPTAIRKAIDFLGGSMTKLDPKDPEAVRAAAGAMKLLTETAMARRLLDARISRAPGPGGATDRPSAESSADGEGEEAPPH